MYMNMFQMKLLTTYCRDLSTCTKLLYNLSARIATCDHQLIHLSVYLTEAKDELNQLILDRFVYVFLGTNLS